MTNVVKACTSRLGPSVNIFAEKLVLLSHIYKDHLEAVYFQKYLELIDNI